MRLKKSKSSEIWTLEAGAVGYRSVPRCRVCDGLMSDLCSHTDPVRGFKRAFFLLSIGFVQHWSCRDNLGYQRGGAFFGS